jgi:hypothetical protein
MSIRLHARIVLSTCLLALGACQSAPHSSWVEPRLTPETPPEPGATAEESLAGPLAPEVAPAPAETGASSTPLAELHSPIMQDSDVQPVSPPMPYYHENLYRKWGVSIGGAAYASFRTTMQINSPVLVGGTLDLEDLLGVNSKSFVGRLDAHYSFNRKHRVNLAYFDIRRSGSRAINEEIDVGGITIPAGQVDTFFNTQVLKLAYRYNFVTDYRTVIGVSGGFHTMKIDTGVRATAGSLDEQTSVKATAPLPLLGIHGSYALSDKWRLVAGVETLRVALDNFEGFVIDTNLNVEHDTWKHIGWGVGFNSFRLAAEIEDKNSDLTANVNYGYSGVMLYLRAY